MGELKLLFQGRTDQLKITSQMIDIASEGPIIWRFA